MADKDTDTKDADTGDTDTEDSKDSNDGGDRTKLGTAENVSYDKDAPITLGPCHYDIEESAVAVAVNKDRKGWIPVCDNHKKEAEKDGYEIRPDENPPDLGKEERDDRDQDGAKDEDGAKDKDDGNDKKTKSKKDEEGDDKGDDDKDGDDKGDDDKDD